MTLTRWAQTATIVWVPLWLAERALYYTGVIR